MKQFKPAFGLSNRHLQTIYSTFYRKIPTLKMAKEIFELDDGDFIEPYWYNKPKVTTSTPIVVILHGLEGSYKSPYIKGLMLALEKINISSVVVHFRNCADLPNRLPRAYHSGDTSDIKEYIKYLQKTYPNNPLHTVGYSMGGNVLLKLLGEYGNHSPLKNAISISAPMQLNISADTINSGFSKIYQNHLLKYLKKNLLAKYDNHPIEKLIDLKKEDIKNIKSIWEFDELYTSKIHKFETAKNYYKLSSSKQYLKEITIPTLIIHALDDPFMTKEILPSKDELSSSITLEVYKNGGHVGFISGSLFKPIYWLENRIIQYILNISL